MKGPASFWSNDAVLARLKQILASGEFLSAAEIADKMSREFGPVTRNSIIAKAYRMHIPLPRSGKKSPVIRLSPKPRARSEGEVTGRTRSKRSGRRHTRVNPTRLAAILNNTDPGLQEFAPEIDDLAIPLAQRRTLMQLSANTCRWPVGDPKEPGFFFCGDIPVDGFPYCAGHCCVAYQTVAQPIEPRELEAA